VKGRGINQIMVDKSRPIPTKIIDGDFDYATLGLHRLPASAQTFSGSLIVKGDVGDNCTIQAEQDIQIDGCVATSVIRAGGNILVKKGVFARGCLDACGDIEVASVENSSLISGGNITIHQGAMHSRLAADKDITVTEGKGILVGGKAKAGMAITAKRIGSPHITPTSLEVGIPPIFRDEYQRLKQKIDTLRQQIDQAGKVAIHLEKLSRMSTDVLTGGCPHNPTLIASGLEHIANNHESVDRFSQVRKLPLWRFRVAYFKKEIEKYTKRFETLEKTLSAPKDKGDSFSLPIEGRVNVWEKIYPGVRISIARTVLDIMEILRGATFFVESREIQWKPLLKTS